MKVRERVLYNRPELQSRASLVLLVRYYCNTRRQYRPEWRIWLSFRNRFLKRQGSLECKYCGETKLVKSGRVVGPKKQATVDHIMPLAKGGKKYDEENLAVSCRKCNEKKGAKIIRL